MSRFSSPKYLSSALACMLLLGCASEDSLPLEGKKISILSYANELVPDADLKKTYLMPKPELVSAWKQAGGLSHHVMQNPSLSAKIMQAWKINIGEGSTKNNRLLAEPVGENGVIYTIDSKGLVTAVNAQNGKKLWEVVLPEKGASRRISAIGSGLALQGDYLFASLGTGEVVALQSSDGQEVWRVNLKSPVRSAPTVYAGRLFVMTADNRLYALAQDDGRTLWEHYSFLESVSLLGKPAPAIDKGIGVATFSSGDVIAFRPESGSILWTQSLGVAHLNDAGGEITDIRARPIIHGDTVFVLSSSGLLSAMDLKTGALLWEREIAGINQPWLAGEMLYVLSSYSELIALEAETGKILWINKLAQSQEDDKDEKLVWTGPVMAGNRLVLTNSEGKAIVLAPQTGTIMGWDEIDSRGTLPPIIMDKTLFFITENGNLVAYR